MRIIRNKEKAYKGKRKSMNIRMFFTIVFGGIIFFTPNFALCAGKFKAVTTFTIIADMARNVAGDAADVESITKPGAEIHEYQPTPRDLMRAQGANLVLWNGLELELWFEKFFKISKMFQVLLFQKVLYQLQLVKVLLVESQILMHGCHQPLL